jgi:hypothetical protein
MEQLPYGQGAIDCEAWEKQEAEKKNKGEASEQEGNAGDSDQDATAADPCRQGLQAKCAQVRRGLVALFTSSDPVCRRLGTQANERFLKGRFSYDPSLNDRYARTGPLWRTLLGIARTELGPDTFIPGETANTLAHEEYHAESIWHNFGEGGANRVGYQCAGPI